MKRLPASFGPLARYDAACRAVATAKSIDEAKDIRDRAIAYSVQGRQRSPDRNYDDADALTGCHA